MRLILRRTLDNVARLGMTPDPAKIGRVLQAGKVKVKLSREDDLGLREATGRARHL